jgi:hypothetical protein
MHPHAFTGHVNGANGMKAGDRIIYDLDGRHGVADEFLYDGDAYVTFDDGTFATVKWNHLSPEGACMTQAPSETGNPMTEQNQQVETRSDEIQWDAIVKNVHTRVALLRAAWRASETTVAPELHRKMVEDIYLPCLAMLAEFCECFDGADWLDAAAVSRIAADDSR